MKKVIFSLALATMAAGSAGAQIRFAPEVGLNLSSYGGKLAGKDARYGIKPGGRAGVMVELGLTDNIYLRPGIQFAMMGGKDGDFSDISISSNYVQVPVNVLYKLKKESGLYFGVVPYVGFCIGGKYELAGTKSDLEVGTDEKKDNIKPLDFGAGVKVGYELPMGLYVDAAFIQGLSNNVPGGDADNKAANRNITLGVGYFFGAKAKKGKK